MKYCYIYTADKNKFKRMDFVLNHINDAIFAVNDLESIAYLKEKGFKALNVDAWQDLLNLITPEDELIISTPEENHLKYLPNVKELKYE
jgi:hypothetical protein